MRPNAFHLPPNRPACRALARTWPLRSAWLTLAGLLLGASLVSAPFFLSGGIKIIYDLALYYSFRTMRPPEEHRL